MSIPYDQPFAQLSRQRQCRILEALIFASDHQVTIEHLISVLGSDTLSVAEFSTLICERIADINQELEATDRPYRIVAVAEGWQFATTPEFGATVAAFLQRKEQRRLSRAALEVLAITAYKQPVTKVAIDAIRGVNSSEVLTNLLERGLITIVGRSNSLGKPLLYGTTDEFLRTFGLRSLADLPKPREIDELFRLKAQEYAQHMEELPAGRASKLLEALERFLSQQSSEDFSDNGSPPLLE